MKERKSSLISLGLPIFIQLMLFNLLSTVDTLMITKYNEQFIISMNNANQVIHMLNVLLLICSTGVGIVIAQYLGAKKEEDAKKSFNNGLIFNLSLSLILHQTGLNGTVTIVSHNCKQQITVIFSRYHRKMLLY